MTGSWLGSVSDRGGRRRASRRAGGPARRRPASWCAAALASGICLPGARPAPDHTLAVEMLFFLCAHNDDQLLQGPQEL